MRSLEKINWINAASAKTAIRGGALASRLTLHRRSRVLKNEPQGVGGSFFPAISEYPACIDAVIGRVGSGTGLHQNRAMDEVYRAGSVAYFFP